ncbi:MAG: holo-ACP synthase [Desulfurispora sp.]|uniref:holo-ACP synthase n=1 Tax=Desulfurispora sp. TaxID=3014275 RepID=UPI00404A6D10
MHWNFRPGVAILPVSQIKEFVINKSSGGLYHCFTRRELASCTGENRRRTLEKLAGRLAAKKAVLRALDLPTEQPVYWTKVEIFSRPGGQPQVLLSDDLGRKYLPAGSSLQISISHGQTHALAIAILGSPAPGQTFL